MKVRLKVGTLVAAAGAIAIAVPAVAHPGPGSHPGKGATSDPSSNSHKCMPHNVAYVESGTVDATTLSTLAENTDGTWTGTLVVDVTRTNHWARADRHTTVTETFSSAKLHVRFADKTTGFTSGERVKLIGKLAVLAKKCTPAGSSAMPVFRMVVVHPVKS
jgi:hypothetical protein